MSRHLCVTRSRSISQHDLRGDAGVPHTFRTADRRIGCKRALNPWTCRSMTVALADSAPAVGNSGSAAATGAAAIATTGAGGR